MSKIIYLTPPAHGHVNPTLPVVEELVRRGEQVICYNTAEFRPQLERAGAAFRAYPDTQLSSAELIRLMHNGNLSNITGLILRASEQLLPFIIAELAREQPDLVIFDLMALWGKIATNRLKLRAAASIGVFVLDDQQMRPLDLLRMLPQILPNLPSIIQARRRLIARYGDDYPLAQPLFPMRDKLNLVFTTRELQPDSALIDASFRFVGPSLKAENHPIPFERRGDGPVVYISLGTIHSNQIAFFKTCFQAFANYPAQFILSAGTQTPLEELGPTPPNFVVRPSWPQLAVLQHSTVFITHAGMNSVHEGLYYGVPQILIPQQFEQLFNARCVEAQHAGLLIDTMFRHKPITPAILRSALDTILAEPAYRYAANLLKHDLQASGGYRQAADEIQRYIATPPGL